MSLLEIQNISKHFRTHWTYRRVPAIKNVSLSIGEGEAFGFLGHNGAGKTTTMKCIVGLLRPNDGSILYKGQPLTDYRLRSEIGYLPELPYFYDHLSVQETVELFAQLYGLSGSERSARVEEALGRVKLLERRKQKVRQLSKGLQQRLGMANTILNRPKLVLLDEPFSGLDPFGRKEFRELILELKDKGTTIFLSTHVLSDIEDICDRVSIMARGNLEATFPLSDLPKMFGDAYEFQASIPRGSAEGAGSAVSDSLVQQLRTSFPNLGVREGVELFTFSGVFPDYAGAEQALRFAMEHQLRVDTFQRATRSLEDVFVEITEKAEAKRRIVESVGETARPVA